jgi:hypothetical protein
MDQERDTAFERTTTVSAPLASAASLATLAEEPAVAERLPLPLLVELRRQCDHIRVELDAAIARQVSDSRSGSPSPAPEADRLLTPAEAAARFHVSKRWLLEHADDIPGRKRLSKKVIRFSERRLARYLERETS